MVNAEGKKNFDKFTRYFFAINVSILMYKKPPEIQYNTIQIGKKCWELEKVYFCEISTKTKVGFIQHLSNFSNAECGRNS